MTHILNIRNLRISRDWTLKYVARKIGVTKQYISLIEMGKALPEIEIIERLELLFDINRLYLFSKNETIANDKLIKINSEVFFTAMAKKNLTYTKLVETSGVSNTAITRMRKGGGCRGYIVYKVALALEIDPKELIEPSSELVNII